MGFAFPLRGLSGILPYTDNQVEFEVHQSVAGSTERRMMDQETMASFLSEAGTFPGFEEEISGNIFRKFRTPIKPPLMMSILNATPDSFFPGSRVDRKSVDKIDSILEMKPDIIDIGGESTRPASVEITPEEELSRVLPIVEYVSGSSSVPISIDTRHPATISGLLGFRFDMINDISGFSDPEMIRIAYENDLNCIIMHMRGSPQTMQNDTKYRDVVAEVCGFLSERSSLLVKSGISPSKIILDPGIGFGKDYEGNMELIRNAHCFNLGFRTLFGTSRKTFIGKLTGKGVEDRLPGTIATSIFLMQKKVDILRVHDLNENRDAVKAYASILSP